MADISSFKIETPKNIDAIFSLDCFRFNEMKGLFKDIYAYLAKVGLKLGDIDSKLNSIPNFDAVTNAIKDLEKRLAEVDKRTRKNEETIVDTKLEL